MLCEGGLGEGCRNARRCSRMFSNVKLNRNRTLPVGSFKIKRVFNSIVQSGVADCFRLNGMSCFLKNVIKYWTIVYLISISSTSVVIVEDDVWRGYDRLFLIQTRISVTTSSPSTHTHTHTHSCLLSLPYHTARIYCIWYEFIKPNSIIANVLLERFQKRRKNIFNIF